MLKLLAPISEKFWLMDALIPSIEVRMPTNAVMPTAIITAVMPALSLLPLMDSRAILIWSVAFKILQDRQKDAVVSFWRCIFQSNQIRCLLGRLPVSYER